MTDTRIFNGTSLFVLMLSGLVMKAVTLKLTEDPDYVTLSGLNPNKNFYPDEKISTRPILQTCRITGCSLNKNISQILTIA